MMNGQIDGVVGTDSGCKQEQKKIWKKWLRNCEMEIPTREMMMSTVNVEGMRACETGRDRWRN